MNHWKKNRKIQRKSAQLCGWFVTINGFPDRRRVWKMESRSAISAHTEQKVMVEGENNYAFYTTVYSQL